MTDNEVKWLIVGKLLRRNLMARKGEQWEVLWEGDLTTEQNAAIENSSFAREVPMAAVIEEGVTYRLTANGQSTVFVAAKDEEGLYYNNYLGNLWLLQSWEEDSGYPYMFSSQYQVLPYAHTTNHFCAYEAGTYHVKIERKTSVYE